ncbi:HPF/RaiA family ribosome-associated protein [Lapillicoccus sp.]|uniref:HPF/RaiA family ribosome-associated protein n=1 Tax=Lapillicoccus sp. TaxID=1909287 RepID=UPI003265FD5C
MNVRVHTDHTIEGHDAMTARVASEVESVLAPHERRLTVVEVHLSDESSGQHSGSDQRCLIEAVLSGQEPAIASHDAGSLDDAVSGAAHKLERVLQSRLGQRGNHRAHSRG